MIELLLVVNGLIIGLLISVFIYLKYKINIFNKLLDRQQEDMAKFSELHRKTLERNKVVEEEIAKLVTEVNSVRSKPLTNRFGTGR